MTYDLNNAKVGEYVYGKHYRCWGVWQCTYRDDYRTSGIFIRSFPSWKDAKAFVYRMNGWKLN